MTVPLLVEEIYHSGFKLSFGGNDQIDLEELFKLLICKKKYHLQFEHEEENSFPFLGEGALHDKQILSSRCEFVFEIMNFKEFHSFFEALLNKDLIDAKNMSFGDY